MRSILTLTGNVLLAGSLLGLLGLGYGLLVHQGLPGLPSIGEPSAARPQPASPIRQGTPADASSTLQGTPADAGLTTPPPSHAINHVSLPRIGLSAEVTPATLVERDGALTWEVPAFKVGHAEATAGAGEPGNAVLLGHVSSARSGDVFRTLDRARVGDSVQVSAPSGEFEYQVVSVTSVARGDRSALAPTSRATVSLITCTGVWLPLMWDYSERLVVRAELTAERP
jgi:LPXTG-site transpeptidase (sortase) family protein